MERRALQLQPALHLQERHRWERGGGGKEARYHLASYRFHRWPPFVNWIQISCFFKVIIHPKMIFKCTFLNFQKRFGWDISWKAIPSVSRCTSHLHGSIFTPTPLISRLSTTSTITRHSLLMRIVPRSGEGLMGGPPEVPATWHENASRAVTQSVPITPLRTH